MQSMIDFAKKQLIKKVLPLEGFMNRWILALFSSQTTLVCLLNFFS